MPGFVTEGSTVSGVLSKTLLSTGTACGLLSLQLQDCRASAGLSLLLLQKAVQADTLGQACSMHAHNSRPCGCHWGTKAQTPRLVPKHLSCAQALGALVKVLKEEAQRARRPSDAPAAPTPPVKPWQSIF